MSEDLLRHESKLLNQNLSEDATLLDRQRHLVLH